MAPHRVPFLPLLAVTTMGVYLLVIVGATTALTDAAAACPTWPGCHGQLLVPPDDAAAIAWGHRVVAFFVGLLVLATAIVGWRRETSLRIRTALAVAVLLYPVQAGVGAVTATTGTPALVSALHLLGGMGIFAGLLLALAWSLEARFPTITRNERMAGDPEPTNSNSDFDSSSTTGYSSSSSAIDDSSSSAGPIATIRAYVGLTKPRLMWLLCLVAAAGMALAAGPALGVGTVVATLLGGVLAIGASGTFNHVLERDIDRKMARTADRPVATDVIPVRNALAFGFALATASLVVFYVFLNLLAALLGLTAILFYSVIYTLVLKPNTVQNTVIGGFAGALPALIGWAAVTGDVGLPALVLAGVIFCWTPAHFYNLALAYREDYERGGFPMLPVVRGERVTRKHIVLYLGATLLAASALAATDALGWVYAVTSVVFGSLFLWAVFRLHREQTRRAAFRSFHASNAYLGALLVVIVIDALVI